MSRRVSLPAADDLFRPTAGSADTPQPSREQARRQDRADTAPEPEQDAAPGPQDASDEPRETGGRKPSGRVRHDEKMTVYITSEELLDLEHARLQLRRDHDLAVDRGRLVREAVALALADIEARGEGSDIVQRLKQT